MLLHPHPGYKIYFWVLIRFDSDNFHLDWESLEEQMASNGEVWWIGNHIFLYVLRSNSLFYFPLCTPTCSAHKFYVLKTETGAPILPAVSKLSMRGREGGSETAGQLRLLQMLPVTSLGRRTGGPTAYSCAGCCGP